MWQCFGVLPISERNLYNDLGSHACKNYTCLKLQALRQYSKVLLISEWNFHSAQSSDICKWQQLSIQTMYTNWIYLSLSLFLFFYIDIMTKCRNTDFPWSVFSRIRKESYPYFPVFGQMSLSIYGKIRFRKNPYFGKFYLLLSCCRSFMMVWPTSITLLGTLRNFTNLLLLHPCS